MRIVDLADIVPQPKRRAAGQRRAAMSLVGFSRTVKCLLNGGDRLTKPNTLTDDIDPRQSESDVPAVAAYHRDKHAENGSRWYDLQGSADLRNRSSSRSSFSYRRRQTPHRT